MNLYSKHSMTKVFGQGQENDGVIQYREGGLGACPQEIFIHSGMHLGDVWSYLAPLLGGGVGKLDA